MTSDSVRSLSWDSFERNYWKYYLKLEKEFLEVIDYIEFVPENYTSYSVKLMQLLLSIGSEVDAVLKEICQIVDKDRPSIADYAAVVIKKYPSLITQRVCIFKRSIILSPFATWDLNCPAKSLPFWDAYNSVKHHRTEEYRKSSLEAVANGLAALFILNLYRLNEIYLALGNIHHNMPDEESKLFYLENWTERIKTSVLKYHYRVYDDDTNSYDF